MAFLPPPRTVTSVRHTFFCHRQAATIGEQIKLSVRIAGESNLADDVSLLAAVAAAVDKFDRGKGLR